ncbi:uncharacterized protein [Ptychodera flava]|uniref:uncharacterized protein n=1 Tax=Ptychodera flava TaxID=63121 RepID=UPI003969E0C1
MVAKNNMKSVYLQCLVLLVTLYSYRVTAITCVSCVYDESVSYNQNHSCLANPTAMPTQECDNDYCVTAAGYYGVDNKLRVYRGCNDSDLYDWTNDCKFFKFNTVIDGYVCICDHRNSCNSDDTAYRKCHQCDSRQDSVCYNDQNGNPAYPCLTGHNNCIMETMEPYPHHGNTYTGLIYMTM